MPKSLKLEPLPGGYQQIFQRDYKAVHAPVANFTFCLTTFIMFFVSGWEMKHVDVTAAVLTGDVDRELYVWLPYNIPENSLSEILYKLHKALYGLKRSLLLWFQKIKQELTVKMGYKPLKSNCSNFVHQICSAVSVRLAYVDDMIFVFTDESVLKSSIHNFLSIFEKTVEPLNWYLGVRISIRESVMCLYRTEYIDQLSEQFKLQDCRTYQTVVISSFQNEVIQHTNDQVLDRELYRNLIGSPLFLAQRWSPDIALAVEILSKFSNKRTKFLLKSIHRVFGYLKSQRSLD